MIFFYSASKTFKIEEIENIHTKSLKILFQKSISLAFLDILSLGLKIEHLYWKLTEFCITLELTMSKLLGKLLFGVHFEF